MKKILLLLLYSLFASGLFAQEICDNGIDDDNDGLIDLNDTTDCVCSFSSVVESLFYNSSFDDFENDENCESSQTNGAPDGPGQADCIAGWEQASDATTDAWHLLTYNGNPPNWPSTIPEPIPSGLAVAGMFIGTSAKPYYREYLGSCLPGGPVIAGEEYRLNFQMGFGLDSGNGADSIIHSPSPAMVSLYGIVDCENLRYEGEYCPEQNSAFGWELITTFTVTGDAPSWQDVVVDFIPAQNFGAIAVGGACLALNPPPNNSFWRRYYFFDDMILNYQSVFDNTITVGSISVAGASVCDEDANMTAEVFPDATYQWYRNGIAIAGATQNNYYPELDADFPGLYSVLITRPEGCGIAGPVDLIRPVVTNAFQDSVLLCPFGSVRIESLIENNLVQEYLWSDGSTEEDLMVFSPGTYTVTITSFCEQTVETIHVVEDVEPDFELIIEPEIFCEGDTIKAYFETDWQLSLYGYLPFSQLDFRNEDTVYFVPQPVSDLISVAYGTNCTNGLIEYELVPANLLDGINFGMLSCANPTTTVIPDVVGENLTYSWYNADNELISNDSTLEVSIVGDYRLEVGSPEVECIEMEEFTVSFNQDEAIINSAALILLSCSQPSGDISVLLNFPEQTLLRWEDSAGNLLGEENVLFVNSPGTYLVSGFLVDDTGDTTCIQTEIYEIPFIEDGDIIQGEVVPVLSCGSSSEIRLAIENPEQTVLIWTDAMGNILSSGTSILPVNEVGVYNVQAFLLNNVGDTICRETDSYNVVADDDIEYTINQAGEGCEGDNRVSVEVATPGEWTFLWSDNDEFTAIDTTGSILLATETYYLTITNEENCSTQDSIVIDAIQPLTLETFVSFPECPSSLADTGILFANLALIPSGGEGAYRYDLGDSTNATENPNFQVANGTYFARVTDARGCEAVVDETVVTFPEILEINAGIDQRINLGDSIRLNVLTNGANVDVVSISWEPENGLSCVNCPNPIAGPYESVNYLVTYTTVDGCLVTDDVRLGVVPTGQLFIPNAFSPNNDGVNDNFRLFPDNSVDIILDFMVFDRWGAMVYQESDQRGTTPGWNGTIRNGKPANSGVYVYFANIRLLNGEEKEFRGTVNLLR